MPIHCNFPAWTILAMLTVACLNGCKKNDGLMEGKCGLSGRRVQCIMDLDCYGRQCGYKECNYCNLYGECLNTENWCMTSGIGCDPDGIQVCAQGRCRSPCNSHDECLSGEICFCFAPFQIVWYTPSAGACQTMRCSDLLSCPEGFVPEDGTLACFPATREGDCWRVSTRDCPPGYEPEGSSGCRMVVPFAWKDAGVPEAGVPDSGVPDAGVPDAN